MRTKSGYPWRKPEKVAYWFFRLNGCLSIVNFVVHPDLVQSDDTGAQRTDVDVLAVRFPYRRELITSGRPMKDHDVFSADGKIDVIIAEVKSGRCQLNGPWLKPQKKNMHRVLFSIGAFPEEDVPAVADALYTEWHYSNEKFRVHLFALGKEKNGQLSPQVRQLTWSEVLAFMYNRFREYRREKAQHNQWDSCGKWLYQEAQRYESSKSFVQKVAQQMELI